MEGIITSVITDPISRLGVKNNSNNNDRVESINSTLLHVTQGFQAWCKEQPGENTIQSCCVTQYMAADQSPTWHESW